ncbi:MAG: TVP38/TMEM64 family protein [Pseudanabaenaceae cyanobacterium bins.68]|nr:TVP38/TMEM64 family protein [Pseudanabaenaceae cyanobacterium bins.68]
MLTFLSLLVFTPLRSWIGELPIMQLQVWRQEWGAAFVVSYVLVYAIATVVSMPATVLSLGAGAVFGLWQGVLWTWIGASLGAIAAFGVARFVARDWIMQKFAEGDRLEKLDRGIAQNGFWFVLSLRLAPIFPFNVVNYLCGLTSLSLATYSLATAIGIVPGTFAYIWLGQEGAQTLGGEVRWQLFGALGLLALLSLLPIAIARLRQKD